MKVSIIILNWNTEKDTMECLESLKTQSYKSFEIVIIDNGSEIENRIILKDYCVKNKKILSMRLFELKENLGFTGGFNFGLSKARGEFVVILNNDTIIGNKDWLKFLLEPMKDKGVGITTSKVLFYDGRKNNRIQYSGGMFTIFGYSLSERAGEIDNPKLDVRTHTFIAGGMCFMIRKSIVDEMGEFLCPEYFIYSEDIDLCWRVNNIGYKIIYEPRSFIYHKGTVTMKKNKIVYLINKNSMRNSYLTFTRNLPLYQMFIPLIMAMLYNFLRCVKNRSISSYFTAIREFFRLYPKVKKYRNGSITQLKIY